MIQIFETGSQSRIELRERHVDCFHMGDRSEPMEDSGNEALRRLKFQLYNPRTESLKKCESFAFRAPERIRESWTLANRAKSY